MDSQPLPRKDSAALLVFDLHNVPQKWLAPGQPQGKTTRLAFESTLNESSVISTRKPFNGLVEGLSVRDNGEGEIRIRTIAVLAHKNRDFFVVFGSDFGGDPIISERRKFSKSS